MHCALNSALVVLLLDPVSHVSTLEVKLFLERLDGEYRERKTRFDLRLEVFLEVFRCAQPDNRLLDFHHAICSHGLRQSVDL